MGPEKRKNWLLSATAALAGAAAVMVGARIAPQTAKAETRPRPADEQVLVLPVQIDREASGIAMVDLERQTIWIYRLSSRGPLYGRLKLVAARSWRYDRMLEEYNTEDPSPEQVREMLKSFGPGGEMLDVAAPASGTTKGR